MPQSLLVKEKASQSPGVQEGLQHDVAKQYHSELHVKSMERSSFSEQKKDKMHPHFFKTVKILHKDYQIIG